MAHNWHCPTPHPISGTVGFVELIQGSRDPKRVAALPISNVHQDYCSHPSSAFDPQPNIECLTDCAPYFSILRERDPTTHKCRHFLREGPLISLLGSPCKRVRLALPFRFPLLVSHLTQPQEGLPGKKTHPSGQTLNAEYPAGLNKAICIQQIYQWLLEILR